MAALRRRVEPALSRVRVPATEFLAMGTRLGEASATLARARAAERTDALLRARCAGLDAWARLCGWPGKIGEAGADVAEMIAAGSLDDVQSYCLGDVVQTQGIALRLALARGVLPPEGYCIATRSLLATSPPRHPVKAIVAGFCGAPPARPIHAWNDRRVVTMTIMPATPLRQRDAHQRFGSQAPHPAGARIRWPSSGALASGDAVGLVLAVLAAVDAVPLDARGPRARGLDAVALVLAVEAELGGDPRARRARRRGGGPAPERSPPAPRWPSTPWPTRGLRLRGAVCFHDVMTINPQLTARVDPAVVDRIDRCAAASNAAKAPGAPPIDRADVVRMLVLRFLPQLEAELGIAAPPAAKAGKAQKGGKRPARKPAK